MCRDVLKVEPDFMSLDPEFLHTMEEAVTQADNEVSFASRGGASVSVCFPCRHLLHPHGDVQVRSQIEKVKGYRLKRTEGKPWEGTCELLLPRNDSYGLNAASTVAVGLRSGSEPQAVLAFQSFDDIKLQVLQHLGNMSLRNR